jgi:hypothetical protein
VTIRLPNIRYYGDQINEGGMGEEYNTHGHMRNTYKDLVGKPEMSLGIILKNIRK